MSIRSLFRANRPVVAIAVLASFASGHYQEAGVVAFFMLMGEIIETRTAEGDVVIKDGLAEVAG